MNYTLSNLEQLEAESIHIMREVVAEFENPVMMYSVGKDSSVMLRLVLVDSPLTLPLPSLRLSFYGLPWISLSCLSR